MKLKAKSTAQRGHRLSVTLTIPAEPRIKPQANFRGTQTIN